MIIWYARNYNEHSIMVDEQRDNDGYFATYLVDERMGVMMIVLRYTNDVQWVSLGADDLAMTPWLWFEDQSYWGGLNGWF